MEDTWFLKIVYMHDIEKQTKWNKHKLNNKSTDSLF